MDDDGQQWGCASALSPPKLNKGYPSSIFTQLDTLSSTSWDQSFNCKKPTKTALNWLTSVQSGFSWFFNLWRLVLSNLDKRLDWTRLPSTNSAPREQVSAPVDQGRSYQICSDIPSCVCIQPLVDSLRGSKGCSLGFPKQYQPLLGYAHIQSLFSSLPLFGPSFDWDHSWVSTPLSFQLTLWLSSTAPTFNTQIVCYRHNLEIWKVDR